MKLGHRAAFYVWFNEAKRFLTYDIFKDEFGSSSSPHAATLFTSRATAERIVDRIRPSHSYTIIQTRTHEPNVIVG